LRVLISPVRVNSSRELLTPAGTPPGIRSQHGKPFGCEQLPLKVELIGELVYGPPMNLENRGHPDACAMIQGANHEAVDRRTVTALEGDLLHRRQANTPKPVIVLVREPPELSAFDCVYLCRHGWCARKNSQLPARARRQIAGQAAAGGEPLDASTGQRHLGQVGYPVFLQQEYDGRTVGGPRRREHVPVESGGQDSSRTAGGGHHRDLLSGIVDQLEWSALHVRQVLAVRAPGRGTPSPVRVHVRSFECGELPWNRGRTRFDNVKIPVIRTIEIGSTLADERDGPAIRRP
jgi:hypothetical protein